MTRINPLAASQWDDSIPVAEDFYQHVNARWLAANPVPAEYPMWGAYIELDHRNKELTRRLLEEAAAAGPDGDLITRLVGDFYASGMDEAAIAAAGAEPLRPYLDRIAAAASVEDTIAHAAVLFAVVHYRNRFLVGDSAKPTTSAEVADAS